MSSRCLRAVIIEPDREAVRGEAGRHGDRRQVGHVGEHREQRGSARVASLAADRRGHRAVRGERRARVGRRDEHVDVVEQRGHLHLEALAGCLDLRELRQGDVPVAPPAADDQRVEFVEAILPVGGYVDELVGRLHECVDADEVVDLYVAAGVDEVGCLDQRVARRGG